MISPKTLHVPAGKGLMLLGGRWMVAGIVLVSLAATCGVTYVLYGTAQHVFRLGIDDRLKSMASIAAVNFDASALDPIQGRESVDTPAYQQAVGQLQRIRADALNIRYAYILRSTDDPNTMQFVADADSLHPDQKIDLNGDGIIDDSDALTYPGDPYDVSPFPEFRQDAFVRPFVDPDFTTSQWGIFLSGTAPIHYGQDPARPTKYAIGLDLDVTQYQTLLKNLFLPFLGFVVFLFLLISFQAIAIRVLWNRQVRQLAAIDRQKDELIGIVSHQLGGPVAVVRWTLQDMIDGDFGRLSEEQKDHLHDVLASAESLSDLISLLLDVSRIELGRLKMNRQKVDLNEFFGEIVTMIDQRAKQKKQRFLHAIPTLPEGLIDKRLTRMTLENLLTNAVKYTPENGEVKLQVELHGSTLSCRVFDTGIGIPPKDRPQIFGKLFRASNVELIDGNGFGLYVAKGAIEQQGGRICFESEEGKGTTFFVELPIAASA